MKKSNLLLLGVAGLLFLSRKTSAAPQSFTNANTGYTQDVVPIASPAQIVNSPIGQSAVGNIQATYGDKYASDVAFWTSQNSTAAAILPHLTLSRENAIKAVQKDIERTKRYIHTLNNAGIKSATTYANIKENEDLVAKFQQQLQNLRAL